MSGSSMPNDLLACYQDNNSERDAAIVKYEDKVGEQFHTMNRAEIVLYNKKIKEMEKQDASRQDRSVDTASNAELNPRVGYRNSESSAATNNKRKKSVLEEKPAAKRTKVERNKLFGNREGADTNSHSKVDTSCVLCGHTAEGRENWHEKVHRLEMSDAQKTSEIIELQNKVSKLQDECTSLKEQIAKSQQVWGKQENTKHFSALPPRGPLYSLNTQLCPAEGPVLYTTNHELPAQAPSAPHTVTSYETNSGSYVASAGFSAPAVPQGAYPDNNSMMNFVDDFLQNVPPEDLREQEPWLSGARWTDPTLQFQQAMSGTAPIQPSMDNNCMYINQPPHVP